MQPSSVQPTLPFADPGFDSAAFLAQVRAAFYTVKRAWAQLKPEISRHVMGEDLWQSQKGQMEVFRLDGCHSVLDGISVDDGRIGEALTVGTDDRIQVTLSVSGKDYVVRDASGEVVRGDPQEDSWTEVWTMQRSREPRSVAEARATTCPECGSPLSLDADGLCQFCHAVIPGAKTDWLVVAVGRPSAIEARAAASADTAAARRTVIAAMAAGAAASPWTGHQPGPLPIDDGAQAGLSAIKGHDPDFAPGDFLAHAREVFTRLDESRNELSPSMIRAQVSDVFYAGEVSRVQQATASGRNQVEAFLDVSSVTVVGAGSGDGRDRIEVRVTATSARHEIDVTRGVMVGGDNTVRTWSTDLTFERAATMRSDPLRGGAGGLCPNCGAMNCLGDDGRCRACQQHVTGGEYDWVLVAEQPQGG
jgi:predicted lipid-binding transport protein (Tim44 family)